MHSYDARISSLKSLLMLVLRESEVSCRSISSVRDTSRFVDEVLKSFHVQSLCFYEITSILSELNQKELAELFKILFSNQQLLLKNSLMSVMDVSERGTLSVSGGSGGISAPGNELRTQYQVKEEAKFNAEFEKRVFLKEEDTEEFASRIIEELDNGGDIDTVASKLRDPFVLFKVNNKIASGMIEHSLKTQKANEDLIERLSKLNFEKDNFRSIEENLTKVMENFGGQREEGGTGVARLDFQKFDLEHLDREVARRFGQGYSQIFQRILAVLGELRGGRRQDKSMQTVVGGAELRDEISELEGRLKSSEESCRAATGKLLDVEEALGSLRAANEELVARSTQLQAELRQTSEAAAVAREFGEEAAAQLRAAKFQLTFLEEQGGKLGAQVRGFTRKLMEANEGFCKLGKAPPGLAKHLADLDEKLRSENEFVHFRNVLGFTLEHLKTVERELAAAISRNPEGFSNTLANLRVSEVLEAAAKEPTISFSARLAANAFKDALKKGTLPPALAVPVDDISALKAMNQDRTLSDSFQSRVKVGPQADLVNESILAGPKGGNPSQKQGNLDQKGPNYDQNGINLDPRGAINSDQRSGLNLEPRGSAFDQKNILLDPKKQLSRLSEMASRQSKVTEDESQSTVLPGSQLNQTSGPRVELSESGSATRPVEKTPLGRAAPGKLASNQAILRPKEKARDPTGDKRTVGEVQQKQSEGVEQDNRGQKAGPRAEEVVDFARETAPRNMYKPAAAERQLKGKVLQTNSQNRNLDGAPKEENPAKIQTFDNSQKGDRTTNVEKIEIGNMNKGDKVEQGGTSAKGEQIDRREKTEKKDRLDRSEKGERVEKVEKEEKRERSEKVEKNIRPQKNENIKRYENVEKHEQSVNFEKPDGDEKFKRMDRDETSKVYEKVEKFEKNQTSQRSDKQQRDDKEEIFENQKTEEKLDKQKIGYKGERPELSERSDTSERQEGQEIFERKERLEQTETNYKSELQEKEDGYEKVDKFVKGEREYRGEKPERLDRLERGERPEESDEPEGFDSFEGADGFERPVRDQEGWSGSMGASGNWESDLRGQRSTQSKRVEIQPDSEPRINESSMMREEEISMNLRRKSGFMGRNIGEEKSISGIINEPEGGQSSIPTGLFTVLALVFAQPHRSILEVHRRVLEYLQLPASDRPRFLAYFAPSGSQGTQGLQGQENRPPVLVKRKASAGGEFLLRSSEGGLSASLPLGAGLPAVASRPDFRFRGGYVPEKPARTPEETEGAEQNVPGLRLPEVRRPSPSRAQLLAAAKDPTIERDLRVIEAMIADVTRPESFGGLPEGFQVMAQGGFQGGTYKGTQPVQRGVQEVSQLSSQGGSQGGSQLGTHWGSQLSTNWGSQGIVQPRPSSQLSQGHSTGLLSHQISAEIIEALRNTLDVRAIPIDPQRRAVREVVVRIVENFAENHALCVPYCQHMQQFQIFMKAFVNKIKNKKELPMKVICFEKIRFPKLSSFMTQFMMN